MMRRVLTLSSYVLLFACGSASDDKANAGLGTNGIYDAGTSSATGSSSGEDPNGDSCEEHVVSADHAAPDMLIVLDRSGSMNPNNNDSGTDRWAGSRDAVEQVTASFADRVNFGLMTFPAYSGMTSGGRGGNTAGQCAAGTVNVPMGADHGDEIAAALSMMNASGRTPTAATLQGALPIFQQQMLRPDGTTGDKYILLVTDGDPNCSTPDGGPVGQPDPVARQATIDAIKALTAASVKTFVVGYQTAGTDFASQLDAMAQAGGTGETMHKSVNTGEDLRATFSQIAGGVISCSFTLEKEVEDPTRVLVTVGGIPRKLGRAEDGFTLGADKRTVTLTGAACDAVKGGAVFALEVKCSLVEVL